MKAPHPNTTLVLTTYQIEYHPYTLAHLEPVLAFQEKHGIVTESYGTLTPTLRHPTGGPIKPVLERIAGRLNAADSQGLKLDASAVLLLWARAEGVVVVTASGSPERIAWLGKIAALPEGLLTREEVEEIERVGKGVHFRHYVSEPFLARSYGLAHRHWPGLGSYLLT